MDPHFWKACAGGVAYVPAVNSDVYYFPQGHAEQAATAPSFLPHHLRLPLILSRVLSVRFLADRETDEVFARIRLRPLPPYSLPTREVAEGGDGGGGVLAFGKRLTPSDANNGGGFSVPRGCAKSIFPELNYEEDPPVQNIYVLDAHGEGWEFRHIYRGTPRRHLLTTGWSRFVNAKKLVSGDSVVFGRRADGQLLVGLRRTRRPGAGEGEGCWRSARGRLPAEAVVAAAEMAGAGEEFEVVYYPKAERPPFVVGSEAVQAAAQVGWMVGLKVKMAVQTEDASGVNHFHGSIESISREESGTWPNSPWRMLQVKWDEPEAAQHFRRVSPWQIELATNLAHAQAANNLRPHVDFDVIPDVNFDPPPSNLDMLPAVGMEGARHLSLDVDVPTAPLLSNSDHREHPRSSSPPPWVSDVSTELRVGCIRPHEEDASMGKLEGNSSSSLPANSGGRSFMLFGQLIPTPGTEQYGDHTSEHGDETPNSTATSITPPFQACGHTKSVKSPCPPRMSSLKLCTR